MVILDTHVWVWWIHDDQHLSQTQFDFIKANENKDIGISAISLWEVAKLVECGRLELPISLEEWFEYALDYPGIRVCELTHQIAIESTRLPGTFHRDPADQIIVATARLLECPLITSDSKILAYTHIQTIG